MVMKSSAVHPYHPPTVPIAGFVPNDASLLRLLSVFGAVLALVVGSAYGLCIAARPSSRLRPIDRFAVAWFALCGFLHVAFERYYLVNRRGIAGSNALFAQLWKEYALSDSRYLAEDSFTISVETITVLIWGPLSWLTLLAILTASRARHVCQIVLCTAHLHGVALYYLTSWTEYRLHGVSYSRPEFLYFWVYYVGFNLPWAVVPLGLLYDSYKQVVEAMAALDQRDAQRKKA